MALRRRVSQRGTPAVVLDTSNVAFRFIRAFTLRSNTADVWWMGPSGHSGSADATDNGSLAEQVAASLY
jgi:hypothetical protein